MFLGCADAPRGPLLLGERGARGGNVVGSGFVVVFKACRMAQSRHCGIEGTSEELLLLLHGGGIHAGRAQENSAFQNSNFALINAISVTVIMDQISG